MTPTILDVLVAEIAAADGDRPDQMTGPVRRPA